MIRTIFGNANPQFAWGKNDVYHFKKWYENLKNDKTGQPKMIPGL
jgi:hypothetical protein